MSAPSLSVAKKAIRMTVSPMIAVSGQVRSEPKPDAERVGTLEIEDLACELIAGVIELAIAPD
ncbi:MAG: hypothetical protein EOO77_11060, partial [Oxalobacteraceae bacterium]